MDGSWIAGSVRARLLVAERRVGAAGARSIAEAESLDDALAALARSPYRPETRLGPRLATAERAVLEVTLLNLRLLLGWLPADAHGLMRTLAAWFELANAEDRIAYLAGAPLRRPFELGGLAVAWPRAAAAQTLDDLLRGLSGSAWGDLEAQSAAELSLALRLAWARRVASEVPDARRWALGAAALLLATELFVVGLPVERLAVPTLPMLGERWQRAATFEDFAAALPGEAAWPLEATDTPDELWQAEERWWEAVEHDGEALLRSGVAGPAVVTGAVALLAADAHLMVAALETAARRGLPQARGALDAGA